MLAAIGIALGSGVCGPTAQAATTHPFIGAVTGVELPETTFRDPVAVAIDETSGDVFIGDKEGGFEGSGAVDLLTPTGKFVAQVTGSETPEGQLREIDDIAVSNATGSIGTLYVATATGKVYVFDASQKYIGEIAAEDVPEEEFLPQGLAVNTAGHLLVSNAQAGVIDEFTATGAFLRAITSPEIRRSGTQRLAANAAGDIYAVTGGQVVKFSPLGEELGVIDTNPASGVAVDSTSQEIYVSHAGSVTAYAANGTQNAVFGAPHIVQASGIALNGEEIYVGDSGALQVDEFGPAAIAPDSSTGTCTVVGPTELVLHGEVNPASGTMLASFQFDYGTTTEYGALAPSTPAAIGAGTAAIAVETAVSGLEPGTTYHYRVVGSNQNGQTEGIDRTCTTPGAPIVDDFAAADATSEDITLSGEISPDGVPTRYFFEYGETTEYASGDVPAAPGRSIGSLHQLEPVSQDIVGLAPETTYHARLTAISTEGISHSSDLTFTTLDAPAALPDGRADELVSAADKEDGEAYSTGGWSAPGNQTAFFEPFMAAPEGAAMSYAGDPSAAGNGRSGNEYLARRTASGWSARDISPVPHAIDAACPSNGEVGSAPVDMVSQDLAKAIVDVVPNSQLVTETGAPSCIPSLMIANTESGGFEATQRVTPPNRNVGNYGFAEEGGSVHPYRSFAGASSGIAKVFFAANGALTNSAIDAGTGANNLYESEGGDLKSVNVLPDGTSEPNAIFGAMVHLGKEEESESAGGLVGQPEDLTHAISDNGDRAVWTALSGEPTRLFLREGGDVTKQIDAPDGGEGEGGGGIFRTASADGSRIFFTDKAAAGLTPDTHAGSGENLYMFNADTGSLADLTPEYEAVTVRGVVGASEDGEYVYFVAKGDLASGADTETEGLAANLYVWHDGQITYITTLMEGPNGDNNFDNLHPATKGQLGDWIGSAAYTTAQVTPDGTHMVFVAREPLTAAQAGGQSEVYLYSAANGAQESALRCVSCVADGVTPRKGSFLFPSQTDGFQPRWITNDGSRIFFDSAEKLVTSDRNEAWDVYEYENGAVHLISGGQDSGGSFFDEATPSGSDVYFTSREPLVFGDSDESTDVYDARVGGGFPDTPPIAHLCKGEECRGAPVGAPIILAAATTVAGPSGNVGQPMPASTPPRSKIGSRTTTNAKKLAAALRACRRGPKRRRAACEKGARRKYGGIGKASSKRALKPGTHASTGAQR